MSAAAGCAGVAHNDVNTPQVCVELSSWLMCATAAEPGVLSALSTPSTLNTRLAEPPMFRVA
jgi:hypothetical protein